MVSFQLSAKTYHRLELVNSIQLQLAGDVEKMLIGTGRTEASERGDEGDVRVNQGADVYKVFSQDTYRTRD